MHEGEEWPGHVKTWSESVGHKIETVLSSRESLPNIENYDAFVAFGSPAGVYESDRYHWIDEEKKYVEKIIQAGKPFLGICFGAQLLASVLGARVYKGPFKEIGWFELEWTEEGRAHRFFEGMPPRFYGLHWHNDTFDLPKGCTNLLSSHAYVNQGFLFNEKTVGFQFHPEVTDDEIREWVKSTHELEEKGRYIQKYHEILDQFVRIERQNKILETFLSRFFK